jgi:hypothetical protein
MTTSIRELDGDELALQAYFRDQDVTDGLPIIIPTRERVDDFLARSGFSAGRNNVVGAVPPLNEPISVEDVAVNTLMAGAQPEALGVLLAAVEAIQEPRFAVDKLQFTTNPVAPVLVINGPSIERLGIGTGNHALGPGRHANGAIGRALRFVLHNLGGGDDDIDHATHGQPAKYTFCFGEAESRSPWEPYHVSQGFSADQSVVTVVGIENIINIVPITDRNREMAGPLLHQLGRLMQAVGTNNFFSHGSPVIVLNPGHAARLQAEGYDRSRLQHAAFEAGQAPIEDYPYGNYPTANWTVRDGKVFPCERAEDIVVLVAGGDEPLHTLYLQPFYPNLSTSREVWTPQRCQ